MLLKIQKPKELLTNGKFPAPLICHVVFGAYAFVKGLKPPYVGANWKVQSAHGGGLNGLLFLSHQEHTRGLINSEQNSSMSGFSANSAG